jgi:hypothetical protein
MPNCIYYDDNTRVKDPADYFTYENLKDKDEYQRLLFMRDKYCEAATCMDDLIANTDKEDEVLLGMKDLRDTYHATCQQMNEALLNLRGDDKESVPDTAYWWQTRMGEFRDSLSDTTRRSTPLGTVYPELEGWEAEELELEVNDPKFNVNSEEFECNNEDFEVEPTNLEDANLSTEDDIGLALNEDIPDVEIDPALLNPTVDINKEEFNIPKTTLKVPGSDSSPLKNVSFDSSIDYDKITSGCIDGDGLFERLMRAVDSSIHLQFTNNRLDNKTFSDVYSASINAAMQTAVSLVTQEKQLELEEARLAIDKASTEATLKNQAIATFLQQKEIENRLYTSDLEAEALKRKIPLEVVALEQQVKASEMDILHSKSQIKSSEIQSKLALLNHAEQTANNKLQRKQVAVQTRRINQEINEMIAEGKAKKDISEVQLEQSKVAVKISKFDALLKKQNAYFSKIKMEEDKATGAMHRSVLAADVIAKKKQAQLHEEQRKGFLKSHRENILRIGKDIWTMQLDTLGGENMVVEAIKGPEFSSRLERAFIDAGL